jgi:type IV pilus assembly protein PilX
MKHSSIGSQQKGVVLIIALVILVLVTLVGLSTIRTTTMEEKMAGNSRDRDKAFQAAEAVVQRCLALVDSGTYPAPVLTPVAAPTTPVWEVDTNWTGANSHAVNIIDAGLAADARCMVEALGASGSYRVTGRAVGGSAETVVMLQATYSKE